MRIITRHLILIILIMLLFTTTTYANNTPNRFSAFRNRKWMKTANCRNCTQWPECEGNSLHLWDFEKGKTKLCHYSILNRHDSV